MRKILRASILLTDAGSSRADYSGETTCCASVMKIPVLLLALLLGGCATTKHAAVSAWGLWAATEAGVVGLGYLSYERTGQGGEDFKPNQAPPPKPPVIP